MANANEPDPGLRDQSMGELFKQLSEELSVLVRQELRLAQAEMTEKGKRAGIGAGIFGGAGLVGVMAFGTLSACFVAALAEAMDVWLAALIVTVVYAAVAAVLAVQGRERIQQATPAVPEQTVETVKEDVQWAKTQLPSGRK
jgi:hypothetical protein